jgi:hypothetical protein
MRALLAEAIVAGPKNFGFRISDFGISTQTPGLNHRGTEKKQNHPHRKHEDTKTQRHPNATHPPPEKPQITQIYADALF